MKFKKINHEKDSSLVTKKIAITSVFLSLAMIFSFLSTLMPLPFLASFLNLNLSSIFLAIIMLLVNFYYSVFAIFITSLLVFANPGPALWVGVLVNFFSNLIFISVLYLVNKLFINKIFDKDNCQEIKHNSGLNLKWHYASEIIAVITTSFILSTLNGLIFTPLFWYSARLLIGLSSPSFIEAMRIYNSSQSSSILMLGIPNYWAGIYALYMAFNLFNFSICSIGITMAKSFIIKSRALKVISGKDLGGLLWKVSNI